MEYYKVFTFHLLIKGLNLNASSEIDNTLGDP